MHINICIDLFHIQIILIDKSYINSNKTKHGINDIIMIKDITINSVQSNNYK